MKRTLIKSFIMIAAALFLLAGCGKQIPKPFTPNENTDKCALCNMAVKNDHFATELILDSGKKLAFDDLGCMEKWLKQNKNSQIAVSYVRDYNTNKWVQLEDASYVHDTAAVKTPMAYDVISFADKKEAQKFADSKQGTLLSYDDLKKYTWERDPAAMKMLMQMKAMKEAKQADKMNKNENSMKQ